MKRLLLPLCGLLLLLSSCSEDFDVAAPYKNITTIFAIFDASDTAHYVRIQKAFLDENKSALDMAREPDSNFYAALDVQLRELDNGAIRASYPMTRVDLNTEGYTKPAGTFFTSPSWAYKTRQPLSSAYRYRLVVTNTQTGVVDSAETAILSNDPSDFRITQFNNGALTVDFPADLAIANYDLSVVPPENAVYLEGVIRFHYETKNFGAGTETDDSADYAFATLFANNASVVLSAPQSSFYGFLESAIGNVPAGQNIERKMDSCDVIVWAATQDYYTYLQYTGAQGGLTADQIKPVYTNIKGPDVLGLVANRAYRIRTRVPIGEQTMDSLIHGMKVPGLKITGRSDH